MKFIKQFNELSMRDVSIAGGKGASLGEMTEAGIPVPPGFVVLAGAFGRFIEETHLKAEIEASLGKVDSAKTHTVEDASENIRQLILSTEMPEDIAEEITASFNELGAEFVAVRSSATAEDSASAAWAGQLDSFLNTTEADLLEKVRACWASLFTPRAIFYRFEKGLGAEEIMVAVVVQKMVDSDSAGIAFSVHPVTEDRDQMIIEAGLGLGEAVVSGQITPDSYVVSKSNMRIVDKNISEQERGIYRKEGGGNEWRDIGEEGRTRVLSDSEILKLAEVVVRVEDHYGFPVDVEWAKEGDEIYIVQSRPITTLGGMVEKSSRAVYEKMFARGFALGTFEVWYEGEAMGDRPWASEPQPLEPYIIFHRTGDIIHVLMDKRGIDWAKGRLLELLKEDSSFAEKIAEECRRRFAEVAEIVEEAKPLDMPGLQDYTDHARQYWPWFEAMWWLLEAIDEKSDKTEAEKKAFDILMEVRKETEGVAPATDTIIRSSIESAYPEISKYADVMLLEEALSGKTPSKEELESRMAEYYYTDGKLFTGDARGEIEREYDLFIRDEDFEGEELAGVTGYPGVARGRVRKLVNVSGVPDFEEGEILVASTTTPDMMPAMKKAVAIISDEGGIVSHAAIVARELKKPCVIGARHAMDALNDGDLVEVDADQGVVRILECS